MVSMSCAHGPQSSWLQRLNCIARFGFTSATPSRDRRRSFEVLRVFYGFQRFQRFHTLAQAHNVRLLNAEDEGIWHPQAQWKTFSEASKSSNVNR